MTFVTFFTLLIGLTAHPTMDGSIITLSESYWSENACALSVPAMRQIVTTLVESGRPIELLDGAACVPVLDVDEHGDPVVARSEG